MVVQVVLQSFDPPVGSVRNAAGAELRFVGWLGLMRAMSDLTPAADAVEDSPPRAGTSGA